MAVVTKRDGDTIHIAISGIFSASQHDAFRDAYQGGTAQNDYIVDMEEVEAIESSGLGMLLLLHQHAGTESDRVSIINANEHVSHVLDIAQFRNVFNIS